MTSVCSCEPPSVMKENQAEIKSFESYCIKRKCSIVRWMESLHLSRKTKLFLGETIRRLNNTQLKTPSDSAL